MSSHIRGTQNTGFHCGYLGLEQVCVWGWKLSCILPKCCDFLYFVKSPQTWRFCLAALWYDWPVVGEVLQWLGSPSQPWCRLRASQTHVNCRSSQTKLWPHYLQTVFSPLAAPGAADNLHWNKIVSHTLHTSTVSGCFVFPGAQASAKCLLRLDHTFHRGETSGKMKVPLESRPVTLLQKCSSQWLPPHLLLHSSNLNAKKCWWSIRWLYWKGTTQQQMCNWKPKQSRGNYAYVRQNKTLGLKLSLVTKNIIR